MIFSNKIMPSKNDQLTSNCLARCCRKERGSLYQKDNNTGEDYHLWYLSYSFLLHHYNSLLQVLVQILYTTFAHTLVRKSLEIKITFLISSSLLRKKAKLNELIIK